MIREACIAHSEIARIQPAADGLIDSEMLTAEGRFPDRNGFTTALAVRALRRGGRNSPCSMLEALERCRIPEGGFGFWPTDMRPSWAPLLPADADDTAIMTMELFLAGRLSLTEARRIACLTIGKHRISRLPQLRPPWLRTGVFSTWHRRGIAFDLIDCTAIANALALFAVLDLGTIPGVRASAELLRDAIAWAGDDELRACSLSPFYPDPVELVLALENAIDAGATDLVEAHALAVCTQWGQGAETRVAHEDHRVCSSPYGASVWRSPALARLRTGATATAALSN